MFKFKSKQTHFHWDHLSESDRTLILNATRETAAGRCAYFKQRSAFACPEPHATWQRSEFKYLVSNDVVRRMTGDKWARDTEIQSVALTKEAMNKFMPLCLNAYWMWKLIGESAQIVKALPLTADDLAAAQGRLIAQGQSLIAKFYGKVSKDNAELSAGNLPSGITWSDVALIAGLHLVMDASQASKQPRQSHGLEVVVNPLLESLASMKPRTDL